MIYLFLGRRKRGKTTLAYYMASKLPRRVIFDPRGLIRQPGAAIARTVGELEQAMDALADGDVREVVYWPLDPLKAVAFPAFAQEVQRWVMHSPDRPLAVLVDEITFVNILEPGFEWALKTCNDEQISFFLTCHRPKQVHVDIRAIANHWCVFRVVQEHDLDVIDQHMGRARATLVRGLADRRFIMWNDDDATVREFADAASWYRPLTPGGQAPLVETPGGDTVTHVD